MIFSTNASKFKIAPSETKDQKMCTESTVPGQIERVITILYFMCLVPVRPLRNLKNSVYLYNGNTLQKVIHMLLQAGGIFYTINELVHLSQSYIYKKPLTIFLIYMAAVELGYHLWWLYAFWRMRPQLLKLIILTTKQHNTASLQWSKLKTGFVLALPWIFIAEIFFVSIVLRLANDGGTVPRRGCYNIFTWIEVANSTSNKCPQFTFTYRAMSTLKIFCYLQTILTIGGHVSVVCTLSILAYDTTKKYIKQAEECCVQNSRSSVINFADLRRRHVQLAENLKEYFEIFNEFGKGFFLSWFCLGVPWISYNVVQSLPGVNILNRSVLCLNWSIMLFYAFQMVYIAGARKQVERLRDIHYEVVLERDPFSLEKGNSIDEMDFLLKNVGLWGGNFFMISYTFLGSAAGLVIAYSFMTLQFYVQTRG